LCGGVEGRAGSPSKGFPSKPAKVQRATALLCELADAAGFFFAGAEPHAAENGDLPRLNRPAVPLGMTLLRLHSDFAQELAKYVGTEMKRAATTYDPHQ
jgi:hypothetical protein